MALADPSSVTINAVAVSLPRTTTGQNTSAYTSADGLVQLTASHSYGKRTRRSIRLSQTKFSADPFIPNQNVKVNQSCYLVIDHPVNGFTAAEIKQLVDALTLYLTASSGARVTQLVGGEN